eukprot:13760012-Heterocapsa_arctica.AAC.1
MKEDFAQGSMHFYRHHGHCHTDTLLLRLGRLRRSIVQLAPEGWWGLLPLEVQNNALAPPAASGSRQAGWGRSS